jgi:hypothetical protein
MSTVALRTAPARSATWAVVPASIAAGALVGLTWGVVARVWMRFISTDPEFTWSGTIFICAAPTVIGALAGLVHAGRRRGWEAGLTVARVPGCLSTVLVGVGAGALMVPTLVPGGLAWARTDWPRWLRVLLGLVAAAAAVLVGGSAISAHGLVRGLVALVWYLGLCVVLVRLLVESYAPSRARRLPAWLRRTLVVVVVVPVLLVAVSLAGIRG